MSLAAYRRKRNFERTPEPRGKQKSRARAKQLSFVVQKHAARRLHYDFRLELDGVLKSWAVPKGPSLVAGDRRMAVEVEDHPLDYGGFEGVIPPGEYGGGAVLVWDRGVWSPIGDPRAGLENGKLDFELAGDKLSGRWHLIRTRSNDAAARRKPTWLLLKGRDDSARPANDVAITEAEPRSVLTERTIVDVANDADRVWSSKRKHKRAASAPRAEAAPRAALPTRLEPQLATLADEAPGGDEWVHELKLDGYRLLCFVDTQAGERSVRLVTRAGHDWTDRFSAIAAAARALPVESALLDGEAVVVDAEGRTSFQALQRALGRKPARGSRSQPEYVAFDLLHLDGHDLTSLPLVERKRRLRELLVGQARAGGFRYADHLQGNGPAFFEAACRAGVEGIVSKRADAPYRSGRSRSWLKLKCALRQELVIIGYTEPSGSRVGLGALLLGVYDDDGKLRYAGKVGTGFDDETLRTLHRRLTELARDKPAVTGAPRMRGVHWTVPRLIAEVSFAEWTDDGRVRHASFLGLREDKASQQVRIERPAKNGDESSVAGVRLSTPNRIYYPDLGLTKRELAEYYEAIAERILPGLAQRPLTLLRCPEGIEGECFYQKRAADMVPKTVPRVVVGPDREPYTMVSDLRSLIELVQLGTLEFHVWGARADRLDRPDVVIFDLDPDPAVPFRRVVDTARVLRELLGELELESFVRSTGGKGLHVVTPLVRRSSWEEVKEFSHQVALTLVRAAPEHLTAVMSKRRRHGKIFIDYLRNAAESTAIASYSARARPGAPVALPLHWEELDELEAPLMVSVRDAAARIDLDDPWADFESSRRSLKPAVRRLAALRV